MRLFLLPLLFSGSRADAPSTGLCMEPSRQFFAHALPDGSVWTWDLSPLCIDSGETYSYSGPGTSGQTFFFNVLGNSSSACSDYESTQAMYESHGVAVQYFQTARGVNRNGCLRPKDNSTCPDYTFGGTLCCSPRRCEVVALEAFTFTLLDAANPGSGGVVLRHMGMPASEADYENCPYQSPKLRRLREFTLTLLCDPAAEPRALTIVSYDESTYCHYRIRAKALAACGTLNASPSPTPSRTGAPSATPSGSAAPPAGAGAAAAPTGLVVGAAGQFGFVVLGAALGAAALAGAQLAAGAARGGALAARVNAFAVGGGKSGAPLFFRATSAQERAPLNPARGSG
jgi:hypothetical protein